MADQKKTKGKAPAPKAKRKPTTPNGKELAAVVSQLYSTAVNLRAVVWGEGSRRALDISRCSLEELVGDLRRLHLAFPLGPEYIVAQQLAAARDEWDLCQNGVIAFNPDTFLQSEFYSSADDVPAGKAIITVKKWSATNMGEYERRSVGTIFDRLDSLVSDVRGAVAELRTES